jgi:OFA family oxalate/formate antiporter-like MFS transporter
VPSTGTGSSGTKAARGVFKTAEDWTLGEALRSPVLWLLIFSYVGYFMGFFIYLAHGIVHLEGLGHSPASAAQSVAVMMLASLLGQFAVAGLGDRIEPRYLFAIAAAIFGIGMALATHAFSAFSLYPYAICMGVGFGAAYTCLVTIQSNYFGPKVYPLVLGVTVPLGTILGAVGPVIAGSFFDAYHSYSEIFYLVAAACFVSAVLLLFAKPPVRRATRTTASAARQPI